MLWNALNHSEPEALSPYQFVMSQHFSKPHICLGLRAATRFHSAHRRGLTREVQHPVIRDGMPSEGI